MTIAEPTQSLEEQVRAELDALGTVATDELKLSAVQLARLLAVRESITARIDRAEAAVGEAVAAGDADMAARAAAKLPSLREVAAQVDVHGAQERVSAAARDSTSALVNDVSGLARLIGDTPTVDGLVDQRTYERLPEPQLRKAIADPPQMSSQDRDAIRVVTAYQREVDTWKRESTAWIESTRSGGDAVAILRRGTELEAEARAFVARLDDEVRPIVEAANASHERWTPPTP